MAIREGTVAGIPARVCRVSFSGELAFEVNVDGRRGLELWRAIDATPYGTEAMHVLRAEKGYPIVGQDTDGTVTPHDLGMDWIVSTTKVRLPRQAVVRACRHRAADRKQLVGLLPAERLAEGAQLVAAPTSTAMLGHVTSSYDSVALDPPRAGRSRSRSWRAAATGSARRSTRTGSPPRSSTPSCTTRRGRAVTAVLREVELEAQVSVRGEPPLAPNTVRGRRALAGAGRVARARRRSKQDYRRIGRRPSTSPRTASASSSRAKMRPRCSPGAARSTCTRRSSRRGAARRRCSRAPR